jgi:hypothetical protein
MTTSTLANRYQINGLVDTQQNVLSNLERMAQACGSYISYDIHTGKWGVVINKIETSSRSFNASNIIGGIQLNGTGITNLYNSVSVEYPLRDTSDQYDSISLALDSADRHDYEPDNDLVIRNQFINEPVQATLVGLLALNQSRVDQTITFVTDYSAIDLTAGEVIDITYDAYSFDEDLFRVVSVNEIDSDDGSIVIEVSAIRYYDSVYDDSNLTRYVRSDRNGIRPIGSIGEPIEPQISVYEIATRPRLEVEAVVPDGLVESMELWISSDNSSFTLVETEYHPGGGTFTSGDTIVFDYDKVNSQDIYVKVRGMNSTTTGPFSDTASYLSYIPSVAASTISGGGDILDDSDVPIGSLLGANGLLYLLNQFLQSGNTDPYTNSNGTFGSVFDQFLNVFGNETGKDLTAARTTNTTILTYNAATIQTALNNMATTTDTYNVYQFGYYDNPNYWIKSYITFSGSASELLIEIELPNADMNYYAYDHTGTAVAFTVNAQPPFLIQVWDAEPTPSFMPNLIDRTTVDWNSTIARVSIPSPSSGTYWVSATLIPTYDLNMNWPRTPGAGFYPVLKNEIFMFNFVVGSSMKFQYTVVNE